MRIEKTIVLGMLFLGLLTGCGTKTQGILHVINGQDLPLEEIQVAVGLVHGQLGALAPQGQGLMRLEFKGDGIYKLRLRFGKDEWVEREIGRVNAGWNFDDTLRIEKDRLNLQSRQWQKGHEGDPLQAEFVEKYSTSIPVAKSGNNNKKVGEP